MTKSKLHMVYQSTISGIFFVINQFECWKSLKGYLANSEDLDEMPQKTKLKKKIQ